MNRTHTKFWNVALFSALFAGALLLPNCKITTGTGKFIATQGFSDKKLTRLSELKVEGRSCRQHILFVPIGEESYNRAFAEALSKSPEGTTGLMNVDLGRSIPIPYIGGGVIFGQYCAILSGYPAKADIDR